MEWYCLFAIRRTSYSKQCALPGIAIFVVMLIVVLLCIIIAHHRFINNCCVYIWAMESDLLPVFSWNTANLAIGFGRFRHRLRPLRHRLRPLQTSASAASDIGFGRLRHRPRPLQTSASAAFDTGACPVNASQNGKLRRWLRLRSPPSFRRRLVRVEFNGPAIFSGAFRLRGSVAFCPAFPYMPAGSGQRT